MFHGIQIIAEVKTRSPFGFRSEKSWEELFAIANGIGDMISIHTDPRWDGSFDLIRRAKTLTATPILAKGIHATDDDLRRAFGAGADWALVVGRVPGVHAEQCFIEPHTIEGLRELPPAIRAVWNARDLETGARKQASFSEARLAHHGWLCQASFIQTVGDIHPQADAVLVGAELETFAESLQHASRR